MPLYLRFLIPLLVYSFYSAAQDTIRIETDTSVIFVIKRPVHTITEKVKVYTPPEKQKLLLSVGFSFFQFWQKTNANSGYDEYLRLVNEHTSEQPGYEIYSEIFKYYKRIYVGLDLHFSRTKQKFNFPNDSGIVYSANNRFNYFGTSLYAGYMIAKSKHFKLIPLIGIQLNKLTSYSGYTVHTMAYEQPMQLIYAMKYEPHIISGTLGIRNLIRIKRLVFDIQPYFCYSPMSYTKKEQPYKEWRTFAGLKIGFVTRLF